MKQPGRQKSREIDRHAQIDRRYRQAKVNETRRQTDRNREKQTGMKR